MTQDRYLNCASCGVRFIWTAAEQMVAVDTPAHCPGCRVLLPPANHRRGVVKFYNVTKGWGFITPAEGKEIFCHRSGLADAALHPLREGDLVEFAVRETPRGPQAVEISRLDVP